MYGKGRVCIAAFSHGLHVQAKMVTMLQLLQQQQQHPLLEASKFHKYPSESARRQHLVCLAAIQTFADIAYAPYRSLEMAELADTE